MTISLRAGSDGTSGAIQIGGVDRVLFNSDGSTNVPGVLTNIIGRNRIINGDMRIDQRNNGVATASQGYTLDRWAYVHFSSGTPLTVQRTGTVGNYSLTLTATASVVQAGLFQKIESVNIADLANKTVTLSFTLSSSVAQAIQWRVLTATTTDNFSGTSVVASGSFNATSTPTRFSTTLVLPAGATNGVLVQPVYLADMATNQTINVTNVQLEEGPSTTQFERRHYTTELALCQRYYWPLTYNIPLEGYGGGLGANTYVNVPFPVRMRATPTITSIFASPANVNAQLISNSSADGFVVRIQSASPGSYLSTYTAGNSASVEL